MQLLGLQPGFVLSKDMTIHHFLTTHCGGGECVPRAVPTLLLLTHWEKVIPNPSTLLAPVTTTGCSYFPFPGRFSTVLFHYPSICN